MKKSKNLTISVIIFLQVVSINAIHKSISQDTERHEVLVQLVLVDVIATDKDGKIISNLNIEDFELFEDGKKMKIDSLDFIDFQASSIQTRSLQKETPVIKKKRFFVIFDSINTIKRMLDRKRREILDKLIELINEGGEVLILEMNDSGEINVLLPFSSDRDLIAQAVDQASGSIWVEKSSETLELPAILTRKEAQIRKGEMPSVEIPVEKSFRDIYQIESRHRFEKSLVALLSAMNMIKDYPGRKPVLLVSGGFPALSFAKLYGEDGIEQTHISVSQVQAAKIQDPFRVLHKKDRRHGDEIFNDLIQFANSYNITFYTLDPDNYLRYLLPDIMDESYIPIVSTAEIKKNELNNLKSMSLDTGGETFQSGKKFEDFKDYLNRDLRSYYELSYYPKRKKPDGKYHKIKVQVRRPDVQIRFRKGYFDYNEEQKQSLLFASASSNPSLFKEIDFQGKTIPFLQNKNEYILWINLVLPVQDLILSGDPHKEHKVLKANIWLDNPDKSGAFNAFLDIPFALTPQVRDRLKDAVFYGYNTCSDVITLKDKSYHMVLTLYDIETNRTGTIEQTLNIPDLNNKNSDRIINAVFGRMLKASRKQKEFELHRETGTLGLDTNNFYPMGSNQFRGNQEISLFLQIDASGFREIPDLCFFLYQNDQIQGEISSQIFKHIHNKQADIFNVVYTLDFSFFPGGNYDMGISLSNNKLLKKIKLDLL